MTETETENQPQPPQSPPRPLLPRHAVWRTDQTSEVMLAQWGQQDERK
jgi:hypothetical protein